MRTSVLSRISLLHLSSQCVRHELRSVAYAQYRQSAHEVAKVNLKRLWVVHRIRRAAEDDSDDRGVVLRELVVGKNLAEGVELTDASSYKLGRLRPEVEDDNLLFHFSFLIICC